jgi:Bacterial sugar transferase
MQESLARLRLESATRVVERHSQFSPVGEPWKRAFDVAMAVVALLLLMPLMLAAAVVIRLLTDGSLIVSEKADWSWRHDLRWLQVPPSSCEAEDHSLGQPCCGIFPRN